MHRLLKRQLKKQFGKAEACPESLSKLVGMVDDAYKSFDQEKAMLERSLELSSNELLDANQGLNKQKTELEDTLEQLKKMQQQIVMQEKLASLGSLTAGIAHEIKNPLNFVNNFGDLSIELIGELKEELEDAKEDIDDETYEEIEDIMGMLVQNISKIVEHGKRADSIVKGMLMHSRGKSGNFDSVDFNAVIDEYVGLAYHGLRAKYNQFNTTFVKNYAEELPAISIVRQNFGRVILNLVNNACYSTMKKKDKLGQAYAPTVTITTTLQGKRVVIKIRDNGLGIPDSIVKKVFNPFFTTKPTGEGTGLGLSLSYDIIRQEHHGEFTVQSVENEFAEFTIKIPVKQ